MDLIKLDAPALVRHLEATRVNLSRRSKTELDFSAGRSLNLEERNALANRRDAVLDVLAARNLRSVNRHGSDVVPALRSMLLDHPGSRHDGPKNLASALYSHRYLDRLATEKEINSAQNSLGIEGRNS